MEIDHCPKILMIDDDQDTCDVIALLLQYDGFELTCLTSGSQALERLRKERFDLLLLDNWMPGTSGVELCKQFREFDRVTPVVFVSAAAYAADQEQAFEAGAQCYLTKPINAIELAHVIAKFTDRRKLPSKRQLPNSISTGCR